MIIGVDNQYLPIQNGQAARFIQHHFNSTVVHTRLPGARQRLYRTWFEVQSFQFVIVCIGDHDVPVGQRCHSKWMLQLGPLEITVAVAEIMQTCADQGLDPVLSDIDPADR